MIALSCSGKVDVAESNGDGVIAMHMFVFCKLSAEHDPSVDPFELWRKYVKIKVYGDDTIRAWSHTHCPFWGARAVAEKFFEYFGMTITAAEKDQELQDHVPFSELSFCSRVPRKEKGLWVLALKKDIIHNIPLWWRNRSQADEIQLTYTQMVDTVREMIPWGEDAYKARKKEMNLYIARYDLGPQITATWLHSFNKCYHADG